MAEISYRVVPRGKNGFDVEMEKPGGRKQTVPGFHSEHEADAWIVQAKRMIRDASPWTPLAPRKPVPVSVEAAKPSPQQQPEPAVPAGRVVAAPRNRQRAAREGCEASG